MQGTIKVNSQANSPKPKQEQEETQTAFLSRLQKAARRFAERQAENAREEFVNGAMRELESHPRLTPAMKTEAQASVEQAADQWAKTHRDLALYAYEMGAKEFALPSSNGEKSEEGSQDHPYRCPWFSLGQVVEYCPSGKFDPQDDTRLLGVVCAIYDSIETVLDSGLVDEGEEGNERRSAQGENPDETVYILAAFDPVYARESRLRSVPSAVETAVLERVEAVLSCEEEYRPMTIRYFKTAYDHGEALEAIEKASRIV